MKIFSPILKGTTTVAQGTTNLSGSFTGSLLGTAATASYADNFTVGGTLTAQTINVQIITSSIEFNTGSTRNGSSTANTHQFTGSVLMSGSLTVSSASTFNGNISLLSLAYDNNVEGFKFGYDSAYYHSIKAAFSTTAMNNKLTFVVNSGNGTRGDVLTLLGNGNVGIGTTIPTFKLEVSSSGDGLSVTTSNSSQTLRISSATNNNTLFRINNFNGNFYDIQNQPSDNSLVIDYNDTERMRITSTGLVLVGQTADNPIVSHTAGVRIGAESIFSQAAGEAMSIQRMNSTGTMVVFYYWPGSGGYTNLGNISTNGSTITFSGTALSDARYKENIVPITNALESINQVDWVEFKFKENQKNSAGITAQQLQTVDALSKFVIDGSDEESYKAVDYNAIIGYLGKSIQELSAKNTSLEERLTALENN